MEGSISKNPRKLWARLDLPNDASFLVLLRQTGVFIAVAKAQKITSLRFQAVFRGGEEGSHGGRLQPYTLAIMNGEKMGSAGGT
jgi:hypothetical protein